MHKYLLRLPLSLWESLRAAAAQSQRSVNAEIIWRLQRSLDEYRR
jgi:predicted HicB family RNase H-like nuclease